MPILIVVYDTMGNFKISSGAFDCEAPVKRKSNSFQEMNWLTVDRNYASSTVVC